MDGVTQKIEIEQKEAIEKEIIEIVKEYMKEIVEQADKKEINYIEIVSDNKKTYLRINSLQIIRDKKEKRTIIIKNDKVIKEYKVEISLYEIEDFIFNDLDSVHAIAVERAEAQFKELFNLSDDDIRDVEIRDFDIIIKYYDKKQDTIKTVKTNYYKAIDRIYDDVLVKVKINFCDDDFIFLEA